MKNCVLKLINLPKREEKLTADKAHKIFGGCFVSGVVCISPDFCCSGSCAVDSYDRMFRCV